MAKANRQAGQNIRELAARRRIKAIVAFSSAGGVIILPLLMLRSAETFVKQISALNPSQPQILFNFPPILYALLFIAALGLSIEGVSLWKRANRADQGAKGEEEIAQELLQLERLGWQIEYGMRLRNRLGDADVVCISPQNRAYVVDVKSHRGEVTVDREQLCRRMGKKIYPFEKSFIDQAMKQALQVKKQKGLKFVTPVIAFSDAKVLIATDQVKKVYIVEKSRLVSLLKSLG
jgi:Nuclease-related domain